MKNPLNLISGQKYKVIKPFFDYDKQLHQIGETWTFLRTNFVPYDDGLTLHVLQNNDPIEIIYRFQWRDEEQAEIIDNFNNYVQIL